MSDLEGNLDAKDLADRIVELEPRVDDLANTVIHKVFDLNARLTRLENRGDDEETEPEFSLGETIQDPPANVYETSGEPIVAVDGTASPDYIGAAYNDGVLQIDNTGLAWADGTDYVTISHKNTSDQSSVDNSNGTVIQDVTLDGFGHVTALGSYDLDNRYYTEAELDGGILDTRYDGKYWQLGGSRTTCYGEAIGDGSQVQIVDLASRQLEDNGAVTLDWALQRGYDDASNQTIDWHARQLDSPEDAEWTVSSGRFVIDDNSVVSSTPNQNALQVAGSIYTGEGLYSAKKVEAVQGFTDNGSAGVDIADWVGGGIIIGGTVVEKLFGDINPGDKLLVIPA